MLEQVGPVELREGKGVGREVRRDPVEDDADPGAVEAVDECHQLLRVAVAARRREIARRLVSPRPVEGVLHQGQELDVREAAPLHVLNEGVCHGRVAEVPPLLPPPAARVHLVDRHGRVERHVPPPRRHPLLVAPGVGEVPEDRSRARRQFGAVRDRIGLLEHITLPRGDGELVDVTMLGGANDALPDARLAADVERVRGGVPRVEVPDDADPAGVRRPDGEAGAPVREGMAPELAGQAAVGPLVEPVDVIVGDGAGDRG